MNFKNVFLALAIAAASAHAACCACAANYASIASEAQKYGASIGELLAAAKLETAKAKELKEKQAAELSLERTASEVIAQTKALDSSGFAFMVARLKAEGVIADAERMRMMNAGYEQSEQEAKEILEEAARR